jgi:hypothetical protein
MKTNKKPVRVLPADVYDTLEFTALAFGGIGRGIWYIYDMSDRIVAPVCYIGHVEFAEDRSNEMTYRKHGIGITDNDRAVLHINERLGRSPNTRVTFKAWCKELNVVRGN